MKLKFALIGAGGYWGRNYLRILSQHENVSDILVCDINQSNLDVVKTNYPELETTTSIDDVMKSNCHAAIICTPVKTHYSIAKKLLENNIHVLSEKVFTSTSEQATELIELAENNNLKIGVGHTFLHNSIVKHISKLLEENELGDIYYASFVRIGNSPKRQDVSAMWDLAGHDLSLILNWFGTPNKISAFGNSYLQDGLEDISVINLTLDNNVIATINVSWLHPCKERKISIVGSKKMLVFDDVQKSLVIYDSEGEHKIEIEYLPPLEEQIKDFINSILTDTEPLSGGCDGRDVVRILEYCQKALKQ